MMRNPSAAVSLAALASLAAGAWAAQTHAQSLADAPALQSIVLTGPEAIVDDPIVSARRHELEARYAGHIIGSHDLQAIQAQLNLAIVTAGYINSGSLFQNGVSPSGVLTVPITTGRLSHAHRVATANGPKDPYLTDKYIETRLGIGRAKVLNTADLQRNFQLLLEDRHIQSLDAELVPSDTRGEAIMNYRLIEKPRQDYTVFVRSDRSPSVGAIRSGVHAHYAAAALCGDDLDVELSQTAASAEVRVDYAVPVLSQGAGLKFTMIGTRARLLDKPLNALDAQTGNVYEALTFSQPIFRRPGRSLTLNLSVDHLKARTALLGSPFSFAPGAVQGVTDYSTLRTALQYVYFSNKQSLVLIGSRYEGLGAQVRATDVDKRFIVWDSYGEYRRVFTRSGQQLILRGEVRFTRSSLYPTEMLSLGGLDTIRGYRQNTLLGNAGHWTSAEYQVPANDIFKVLPSTTRQSSLDRLKLSLFADSGRITRTTTVTGPRALTSVGIRTQWAVTRVLDIDLTAARATIRSGYKGNVQDNGFGLDLKYRF